MKSFVVVFIWIFGASGVIVYQRFFCLSIIFFQRSTELIRTILHLFYNDFYSYT